MTHEREADDWYVDPTWCTELLLGAIEVKGSVWDPCAGQGTIVAACTAAGLRAFGTDVNPKAPQIGELDFMGEHRGAADNIIFNPPYRDAEAFIRRAIALARGKVAVLLQEKFPYSQGRYVLFKELPPAKVLFFSSRPSMPPGNLLRAGMKPEGGKINYLWFVWDRDHRGPTICDWLLLPEHADKLGVAA